MQEQNNNILDLRQRVVDRAKELALHGNGSPQDRLQILMGLARSGRADYDVLSAAFELSNNLPSDDDKLSALLDILYEIDNITRTDGSGEVALNNETSAVTSTNGEG